MRIVLKVIARAKKEIVEKISENTYRIKVTAPPEKGKANKRVVELLSEELGIKKQDIRIISGATNSRKIIEIDI
ncbi:MAG: DUF167 domain-containing protein [Candidatus Omnitrophota bacterium]|nr:DUF167 domain-containing protein [Candidatus Omnitrophota bacterium]